MAATKRWWRVGTKTNDERGSDIMLGIFYGYLDEVALHLADQAQGFYQDVGTLTFRPADQPVKRYIRKREKVNIQVYDEHYKLVENKALVRLVASRPVELVDSKYSDCTLLHYRGRKE